MSDNLRAYIKTLYAMDGVVRRAKGANWDADSPNEDWSARETLGHVIWGLRRITNAIKGDPIPPEEAEASVAGEDPVATWSEALENVMEALDHRGVLSKQIDTPFGTMTVDDAIGSFLVDPLTHAWDIATAFGMDAALPDELAARGIALVQATGDAIRGPGRMGAPIDVDEAAPPVDRFIALTGRNPNPS